MKSLNYRSITIGLIAFACGAAVVPAGVHAQKRGFTLNKFRPAEMSTDGFVLRSAEDLGHLQWGGVLYFDYAHDPLVYEEQAGQPFTESLQIVRHLLTAHLTFSLGLVDRVILFAGFNAQLVMKGDDGTALGIPGADGAGVGDVSLGGRFRLYGERDDRFQLGLRVALILPLAEGVNQDQTYAGESTVSSQTDALLQFNFNRVRLFTNLGFLIRSQQEFPTGTVGSELTFGLGTAALTSNERVEIIAEMYGSTRLKGFFSYSGSVLEVIAGARTFFGKGFSFGGGGGGGVTRGVGTAEFRFFVMVGYQKPAPVPHVPDAPGQTDEFVPEAQGQEPASTPTQ